MSSTNSSDQGDQVGDAKLGYKEQLDQAAQKVKNPENNQNNEGGLLAKAAETVNQYVPAAGKALGLSQDESKPAQAEEPNAPSGPPERPQHDVQIEEFVRDQHRSKPEDAKLAE